MHALTLLMMGDFWSSMVISITSFSLPDPLVDARNETLLNGMAYRYSRLRAISKCKSDGRCELGCSAMLRQMVGWKMERDLLTLSSRSHAPRLTRRSEGLHIHNTRGLAAILAVQISKRDMSYTTSSPLPHAYANHPILVNHALAPCISATLLSTFSLCCLFFKCTSKLLTPISGPGV